MKVAAAGLGAAARTWHRTALWLFVAAVLAATGTSIARAQTAWVVGEIVGLREGTCIREGPGLEYPAHTRVPEDEWAVRVIDGPRTNRTDRKTWYDTSRHAAGDPSGGTGWVDQSQTDMCPESLPDRRRRPIPEPEQLLERLRDWWRSQTSLIKWLVAVVVLAALVSSWRALSSTAFRLLGFVVFGLLIYWLVDAVRPTWQPTWTDQFGSDAPDLALLLALTPALSWLVRQVRMSGRR